VLDANPPNAEPWDELIGDVRIGSDGFPIVAFARSTLTDNLLKVARCSSVDCTTQRAPQVIEYSSLRGSEYAIVPSIAIGNDGLPVIAYTRDPGNGATTRYLAIAKCGTASCR
jgi:hypothetical protein